MFHSLLCATVGTPDGSLVQTFLFILHKSFDKSSQIIWLLAYHHHTATAATFLANNLDTNLHIAIFIAT